MRKLEPIQNLEGGVMKSNIEASDLHRGCSYSYDISVSTEYNLLSLVNIKFQCGDPREYLNGIRDEDLIRVLIDRAQCQSEAFPSQGNEDKVLLLSSVMKICNNRAKARIDAGIQGDITKPEIKEVPEYQKRVLDEADDLLEKMTKLEHFNRSFNFKSLPQAERLRMRDQYEVMVKYHKILVDRMLNFKDQ